MSRKKAVIIGAGPAGLTAAYELSRRTDISPITFEKNATIGGIAKTIEHNGNRMDIGGHRFFSKSQKILRWWLNIMPLKDITPKNSSWEKILHNCSNEQKAPHDYQENAFLNKNRSSQIYFKNKYFDYPVDLSDILFSHPLIFLKASLSYIKQSCSKKKPETNIENFFINKFGHYLYEIFFKTYTEKVWGLPCSQIPAVWGAQRIKNLSALNTCTEYLLRNFPLLGKNMPWENVHTSLIKNFLYPPYGPGQFWTKVAQLIEAEKHKIHTCSTVEKLICKSNRITSAIVKNTTTNQTNTVNADYFFSTMPVDELVRKLDTPIPGQVIKTAFGLKYRSYIIAGLLIDKNNINVMPGMNKNQWIYIQDKTFRLGRIQIFNNWSQHLVRSQDTILLGAEYFCDSADRFWNENDSSIIDFAAKELRKLGFLKTTNVLDGFIAKEQKAYPSYCGTYTDFNIVRDFLSGFDNLFLIGRNGMHQYNNMDHSMLSAITAVENILNGRKNKDNIWQCNPEL